MNARLIAGGGDTTIRVWDLGECEGGGVPCTPDAALADGIGDHEYQSVNRTQAAASSDAGAQAAGAICVRVTLSDRFCITLNADGRLAGKIQAPTPCSLFPHSVFSLLKSGRTRATFCLAILEG